MHHIKLAVLCLSCILTFQSLGNLSVFEVKTLLTDNTPPTISQTTKLPGFSHEIWDQLLGKYVSASGKVNYKGLLQEKSKLEEYLNLLSANTPQPAWKREKVMAWWINVYNAFTIKLILEHYPVKSIKDIDKPWDTPFIKLGGKTYTLNQVEHEMLRARYKDPRIHFAVNCASFSCPSLPTQAFTEANLNQMLEKYTRAFINDSRHNSLSSQKAEVSSLFDWYKEDFTKQGTVIDFINKYTQTKLDASAKITYKTYNWSLNE